MNHPHNQNHGNQGRLPADLHENQGHLPADLHGHQVHHGIPAETIDLSDISDRDEGHKHNLGTFVHQVSDIPHNQITTNHIPNPDTNGITSIQPGPNSPDNLIFGRPFQVQGQFQKLNPTSLFRENHHFESKRISPTKKPTLFSGMVTPISIENGNNNQQIFQLSTFPIHHQTSEEDNHHVPHDVPLNPAFTHLFNQEPELNHVQQTPTSQINPFLHQHQNADRDSTGHHSPHPHPPVHHIQNSPVPVHHPQHHESAVSHSITPTNGILFDPTIPHDPSHVPNHDSPPLNEYKPPYYADHMHNTPVYHPVPPPTVPSNHPIDHLDIFDVAEGIRNKPRPVDVHHDIDPVGPFPPANFGILQPKEPDVRPVVVKELELKHKGYPSNVNHFHYHYISTPIPQLLTTPSPYNPVSQSYVLTTPVPHHSTASPYNPPPPLQNYVPYQTAFLPDLVPTVIHDVPDHVNPPPIIHGDSPSNFHGESPPVFHNDPQPTFTPHDPPTIFHQDPPPIFQSEHPPIFQGDPTPIFHEEHPVSLDHLPVLDRPPVHHNDHPSVHHSNLPQVHPNDHPHVHHDDPHHNVYHEDMHPFVHVSTLPHRPISRPPSHYSKHPTPHYSSFNTQTTPKPFHSTTVNPQHISTLPPDSYHPGPPNHGSHAPQFSPYNHYDPYGRLFDASLSEPEHLDQGIFAEPPDVQQIENQLDARHPHVLAEETFPSQVPESPVAFAFHPNIQNSPFLNPLGHFADFVPETEPHTARSAQFASQDSMAYNPSLLPEAVSELQPRNSVSRLADFNEDKSDNSIQNGPHLPIMKDLEISYDGEPKDRVLRSTTPVPAQNPQSYPTTIQSFYESNPRSFYDPTPPYHTTPAYVYPHPGVVSYSTQTPTLYSAPSPPVAEPVTTSAMFSPSPAPPHKLPDSYPHDKEHFTFY